MTDKYLKRKFEIISANLRGVAAACYMLGNSGAQFNMAAVDMAEKEIRKELENIKKYYSR